MTHHRRGLRRHLRDDTLADGIEADWRTAGLSEKRVVMLDYAVRLTRTPEAMEASDIDALRLVGFGDIDILHITEIVGYYAYTNRIADGLDPARGLDPGRLRIEGPALLPPCYPSTLLTAARIRSARPRWRCAASRSISAWRRFSSSTPISATRSTSYRTSTSSG